jgi:peptide/nickel transport system substrate-binding protein
MATKKRKMSWKAASFLMVFVLSAGSFALAAEPKGEVVYSPHHGSWYTRVAYDPHTGMGGASVTLKSLAFDSLTTKDGKGADVPALAESWKIAADQLTADFTLRKGVTFHNGDPFSAKDVKFSIERAMREDLRFVFGAELRRYIASVEIVDDYHVRIHLKEPYAGILERLYGTAIVPKGYVEKVGDAGFAAKPVGAGPFRVVNFARDRLFEVEAVQNHYRKTPFVKKFTIRNVAEPATRLAMLKTGETDFIALPAAHIPSVKKDPNLKIFWNRHCLVHTLAFFDLAYPEDSPFKDPRVRRATSLAIDRKGIGTNILHGSHEPWGSFFAPYHPGFDASRNLPDPYDPEKSKQLLAEAGYANGFDTVLVGHPGYRPTYEAIQQQLKDVGIRAKLQIDEAGSWASTFVAGKYRGIGYAPGPFWSGITHPGVAAESHVTGTWSHNLAIPAVKKAMDSLMMASGDTAIAEGARELDKILLKEMRRIPLWSVHQPFGASSKIEEFGGFPGLQHPMGFEFLKVKDK